MHRNFGARLRDQTGDQCGEGQPEEDLWGVPEEQSTQAHDSASWSHYFSTTEEGNFREGEVASIDDWKLTQCAFALRLKSRPRGQGKDVFTQLQNIVSFSEKI